ncbi:hypothetical protein CUR178_02789 [Leishmania enriettii]|uniref:Aminopeptidase n=1 Tax=Leishmania enriettii TaxID=5663 RepID=A0A836KGQ4_LEIEN|nr:hypothetical protein CUR178_02789 [Leishmania enriettii]
MCVFLAESERNRVVRLSFFFSKLRSFGVGTFSFSLFTLASHHQDSFSFSLDLAVGPTGRVSVPRHLSIACFPMALPTDIWNPISCTLQLVFSRPSSGGAIRAGCAYHGTSIIRYRREPYRDADSSDAETTFSSAASTPRGSSEYDVFLRHRRLIAEKNALHVHALTTAGGIYKDAEVLDVQSYQVRCVSACDRAAIGLLKVVSVEQEDAGAAAAGIRTISGAEKAKRSAKGFKKGSSTCRESDALKPSDSVEPAAVDWGSKLIVFEGGDRLPPFSEVDLTVHFVGAVQSFDHGGIYAARSSDTHSSAEDVPLLTHFEVRYARCAFPSPDDPQYRLDWALASIQLPDRFQTILTNGEERGRKELAAQQAIQVRFAPCGPLPVYAFSFACFPDRGTPGNGSAAAAGLEVVKGSLTIPTFAAAAALSRSDAGALSYTSVPVRVLARRRARIAPETLQRILRVTIEAVTALQQLFQCPLPLLQCEHFDVLLGPTMPYISGMEHHCSIILNETIYQAGKRAVTAGEGGGVSSNAEVTQTELIVHEVAHHWVGNALGLPFAVKEGICQVIEQLVGDTLLGKPMRTYKADSGATVKLESSSPSSSSNAKVAKSVTQASERGREFTGASYQNALSAIKRLVAHQGFDSFVMCLRQLIHVHVVAPAIATDENGGVEVLRRMGAETASPPYISTEAFLRAAESSL